MKPILAIFLLPLAAALSACDTQNDAATPADTQDRPANVSDPGREETGTTGSEAPRGTTPGTRRAAGEASVTPGEDGGQMHAVAEIMPTSGNEARGAVRLSGSNGTVQIAGSITGLEPGAHGFHIHQNGDCSAPDASSAGDHFNPHDAPHGSPRDLENARHVGDLGNITANEQGEAEFNVEDNQIKLSGPDSVIGKAFVVHADQDDLESQPSGNAGARLGCGEIVESSAHDSHDEPRASQSSSG
jgi:superoxide dismutase, Cu-Zn family